MNREQLLHTSVREARAKADANRAARIQAQLDRLPGCTRAQARCRHTSNPQYNTAKCCIAHNVFILRTLAEMMDAEGIRWWIDYGTLLGHMTHGGFYPNDKDTDLGVYADDRAALLALLPRLNAQGFNATYAQPKPGIAWKTGDRVKVRLSQLNHNNCDIFIWERRGELLDRINYIGVDRYKGREFPVDWALPLQRATWEGIDVSVPAEPLKLVEHRYGPNWRNLPRAKHDGVRR